MLLHKNFIFITFIVKRVNSNNNFLTNNNNNSLILKNDAYKMKKQQQDEMSNSSSYRKTSRSCSISESFGANKNRTRLFSVIPSKTFHYLDRLMSVGN